jgi:hypothetical protein
MGRVWKLTRRVQIVWILLEKERWLTVWIMAHLNRVRSIVATDAIDATYRKHCIQTSDWDSNE